MKRNLSADRLQVALMDKEMSAAELSRQSGLSRSHISHYVNGTHTPGNVAAKKMGDVLGCSPVWLMGFENVNRDGEVTESFETTLATAFNNADDSTKRLVAYALGLTKYLDKKEGE